MRQAGLFRATGCRWIRLVILTAGGLALAGCLGGLRHDSPHRVDGLPPSAAERAAWAQPISTTGVPNLCKVDADLYRGGQPKAEGFGELAAMGIKTVVNLRTTGTDRGEIASAGLAYERIWFRTWHPEDEDAVRFLRIVTDPDRTPVFVHCRRGADRTGMMCAVYRVVVCGRSKEEAIREMTEGGFGFDRRWQNLVRYVRELDVERIRRETGLVGRAEGLEGRLPANGTTEQPARRKTMNRAQEAHS